MLPVTPVAPTSGFLTRDGLRTELTALREQVREILRQELSMMKDELLSDLHDQQMKLHDSNSLLHAAGRHKRSGIAGEKHHIGHARTPTTKSGFSSLPTGDGKESSVRMLIEAPDDQVQQSSLSRFAQFVISTTVFENFALSLVILNSIWMGIEADYAAQAWSWEVPVTFQRIDWMFCIGFVVEVVFKMLAKGGDYWIGPDAKWNIFDFLVAFSQLADSLIQLVQQSHGNIFISTIRMLRLVRIVRVARVAVAMKELRALITSISASMVSLFWTLLLIFLIIYMFGIGVVQVVNDAKINGGRGAWEEEAEELLTMFNSLDSTMITLYMIISEGIHWKEVLAPLETQVSIWMRPAMCLYVAFQLFAMMNVITAYFVDATMKQAAETTRVEVAGALWEMLELDAKERGIKLREDFIVTKADFLRFKHHPKMHDYVELIGCTMEEFDDVFNLIDADGDETLSGKEFIHGASALMGTASASNLARLRLSNRFLSAKVNQLYDDLESVIKSS